MSYALVGTEWGAASVGAVASLALPAHTVSVGNTIMVSTVSNHATPANAANTVTDSLGNAWSTANSFTDGAGKTNRMQLWKCVVAAGKSGSTVITVTPSATSGVCAGAWEFSGGCSPTQGDANQSGTATSTSASSTATAATVANEELLIGYVATPSGTTAVSAQAFSGGGSPSANVGTLWQNTGANPCSIQAAWALTTSLGAITYTATLSPSQLNSAAIRTFFPAAMKLAGSSVLAAVGAGTVTEAVAVAGTSTTASVASGGLTEAVALSGSSTLTVGGIQDLSEKIALLGSSVIVASSSDTLTEAMALGSTSTLATVASATLADTVALLATSTWAVTGSATVALAVAMSAASTLTLSLSETASESDALVATASLISTLAATLTISQPLALVAAITASSGMSATQTQRVALAATVASSFNVTDSLTEALALAGICAALFDAEAVPTATVVVLTRGFVYKTTNRLYSGVA